MRHLTAPRTATLALATLLVMAGCGQETDGDDTSRTASSPSTSAAPETSAPATPSAPQSSVTQSSEPGGEGGALETLAAYFVGDTPAGPRLFREFRSVPAADPLAEAVLLVTSGDAMDPDYRTLFPGGSFASVTHDEASGRIVAELADDGWVTPAAGMTRKQAQLALQQLVHTAQAAVQERVPVVVTLGGEPSPLFGIDTSAGISNDDPIDVLALVNVTTPEQGGTISGSFKASGVASALEATVPWEIRRGQEMVLDGFATAEGWMDKLYPWQSEAIDVSGLAPGTYTFVASTGEAAEGEGNGATTDSKEFTVR